MVLNLTKTFLRERVQMEGLEGDREPDLPTGARRMLVWEDREQGCRVWARQ